MALSYREVQKLQNEKKAKSGQIYDGIGSDGRVYRWIGTADHGLRLLNTSPVTPTYNSRTVPVGTGVQSVTGSTPQVSVNNSDPYNPVIDFNGVDTDGITITGNGTSGNPLVGTAAGGYITAHTDTGTIDLTVAAGSLSGIVVARSITFASQLQNIATDRVLGRDTAGAGAVEELTIGAGLSITGGALISTLTGLTDGDKGDITVSASGATWTIDNDVVTFAKFQNISTDRVLGRDTAGSGDVEELTIGAGLQITGGALVCTISAVPTITATQVGYGDGANLLTSDSSFLTTSSKITISKDGTGTLGALYLTRGDSVNQYIVLHENVASPNSAYLTFKSSGGNAIAMGAIFTAGAPVSYVFTDPTGTPLNTIDTTTGNNTLLSLAGVGSRTVVASAAGLLSTIATTSGTVTSVSGTANRITSTGGATPVIDIAAAYDALWQPIDADLTAIAAIAVSRGSIIVGDSAPTWSELNLGTAGKILRSDGTDLVYSTSTFADTYGVSTLLYNASANTVSGLATANSGILITSGAGVPSIGTAIPNGVTATTQAVDTNNTTVATTAYVDTRYTHTITFGSAAQTPADSTTYYMGVPYDITMGTTAQQRQVKVPYACTLIGATISILCGAGTGETFTGYIRINNTTDVTLYSTLTASTSGTQTFVVTGLSTALAANDLIEGKVITPAWVTNPTVFRIYYVLYFK